MLIRSVAASLACLVVSYSWLNSLLLAVIFKVVSIACAVYSSPSLLPLMVVFVLFLALLVFVILTVVVSFMLFLIFVDFVVDASFMAFSLDMDV
ncbi:MAG: hypothetical protein FWD97_04840 [Defluviitaleaceae bacterium]|nr:hypothetical protein [Defluviitaleaceae bacterium]